jgi:hypothetical protein
MKALAVVAANLLLPAVAAAADSAAGPADPGYTYPRFVHTLLGAGGVPTLPVGDRTGNVVLTTEIGGHPLTGALGTGFSLSETLDMKGQWSVFTPGLLAQLDLTYLAATALYTYLPPRTSLAHLQVGGRLGLAFSESSQPSVAYEPSYELLRPELQPFVDLDVPVTWLGRGRHDSLIFRGAVDCPVNLSSIFRWSLSVGLSYGWGQP